MNSANGASGGGVPPNNRSRRLVVGVFVLVFVDVLWVGSSELTKYLFQVEDFKRPFFTTYVKSSMFIVYLLGFVFQKSWRDQCINPPQSQEEGIESVDIEDDAAGLLSSPEYEPIRVHSSEGESDVASVASMDSESATTSEADLASYSRLSYEAWRRIRAVISRQEERLPIRRIAKLALQFCFLWFLGNVAYQEALNLTAPGIVNVISSSSSLFTLIFAAIFPSVATDRFTLSKLAAVALSIGGVALITFVDSEKIEVGVPFGIVWTLIGSIMYALYLVLLRRRVDSEDKLNIPMFFGFVGLFNMILLWPGFYFLNISKAEPFYPLPNRTQLMYVALNGMLGTVLSEYLWLWGCFLTSSLIATLSLSLMVPMTIVADMVIWKKQYPWPFILGSVMVLVSFIFGSILVHCDNWDPLFLVIRKIAQKLIFIPWCCLCRCCRRLKKVRLKDLDSEQSESLIGSVSS